MAASFEGSSWLVRSAALKGVSNSKAGTILCWVKFTDQNATNQLILDHFQTGASARFRLIRTSGNLISVLGQPPGGGSTSLILTSSSQYTTSSGWIHIAASWDLSAAAGHLYINGSDDLGTSTLTDTLLDYTSVGPWTVGVTDPDGTQSFPLYGDLYDLVFWPGTYVALSTQSNLLRFISSDGFTDTSYTPDATYPNPGPTAGTKKPIGYGAAGDKPTSGVRPAIMFTGGNFYNNRGTGGPFSLTGTLDGPDAATDSSDSNEHYAPQTYRQSARYSTPGERWFDSEQSGFSYPRSKTFIERREGLTSHGRRLGEDERDDTTRDEYPGRTWESLIFPDREEDIEERDR